MPPSRSRSSCATSAARSATGTTPRSSAALGLDVVRMIEAVDESRELGGVRVSVEEFDPLLALQGELTQIQDPPNRG